MKTITKTTAKPFLKWVGGKGQLLQEIDKRLPREQPGAYYEPFLGGGSVLFHILEKWPDLKKIVVSDSNRQLINCYLSIKNKPRTVIELLEIVSDEYFGYTEGNQIQIMNYQEKVFYRYREFFNLPLHPSNVNSDYFKAMKTAWFIFLNKTCFNGLYRVNRDGKFNTSFGKYEKPLICDKENILRISELLNERNVEIYYRFFTDYNPFLEENQNSFWYLDPPYHPISKTSDFTGYTALKFNESDQKNVSSLCGWLSGNNARFLASNSNTEFIRNLYEDFEIEEISAKRSINSDIQKRGKIKELLIRNYEI